MKLLNGSELAGYVKERQAKAVRGLRQAWHITPKLAIIITKDDSVINKYVGLKERYAQDILIDVEVYRVDQDMVAEVLDQVKKDNSIHGVIVQLPLQNPKETSQVLNLIPPAKDVDGLGDLAEFDSATATAINWLLTGYNIELSGKKIVLLGRGKLVGAPLEKMWQSSGYDVVAVDETTFDETKLQAADIIVSATGVPGILKTRHVKTGAVVIDAGTASEGGKIVGDAEGSLYERDDISITPKIGGVGPLTIASLFENVITAARGSKGELPDEE